MNENLINAAMASEQDAPAESLSDLRAALTDRGQDTDYTTDPYDGADLLRVWDAGARESYTLVGEALDENRARIAGFTWSWYEARDDGPDWHLGGDGYAPTLAGTLADIAPEQDEEH